MKKKLWHGLVKPSTVAFTREGRRTPGYSWFDWLHGYVYARWPYLYIGIGTGEHRLAKVVAPLIQAISRLIPTRNGNKGSKKSTTFADTYHGKVVPLEQATRLITIHEEIRLPDLEQVIPYTKARAIILENPEHIVALDCPCRVARENPCLPLDVCLIVGDPFASFVAEHHPKRSRQINREEAMAILRAEDERGHVHHAFFKDAMLGRFYAICNCCDCCCGAMQAQRNGTPMLASSGYVCLVNEELCIGCENCLPYCQFKALALGGVTMTVDEGKCMGCGVCVSKCEQEALTLIRAPEKGIPLEVEKLMEAVG
jgi:Pyruvate/2-oxoacid:ferredoxin oxidoreductase delta subunit